MKMKVRRITFDTVTGRQVDPRQEESFDGRFQTSLCYWNGDEWLPIPRDPQSIADTIKRSDSNIKQ